MVSRPILKCSSERCVCAPQYTLAGTSIFPMLSDSVRVFNWDRIAGSLRAVMMESHCPGYCRKNPLLYGAHFSLLTTAKPLVARDRSARAFGLLWYFTACPANLSLCR